MIWIFSIVSVSLVAILIQTLLVYQKKAYDLRMRQAPIRKKIKEHILALQEMTKNIRRSASERVTELEISYRSWSETATPLKKTLEELEKLVPADTEEGEEAEEESEEEAIAFESDEIRMRKLLTEAKHQRTEMDSDLNGIARDTDLVKRTLEQMEAKLKRIPAANH